MVLPESRADCSARRADRGRVYHCLDKTVLIHCKLTNRPIPRVHHQLIKIILLLPRSRNGCVRSGCACRYGKTCGINSSITANPRWCLRITLSQLCSRGQRSRRSLLLPGWWEGLYRPGVFTTTLKQVRVLREILRAGLYGQLRMRAGHHIQHLHTRWASRMTSHGLRPGTSRSSKRMQRRWRKMGCSAGSWQRACGAHMRRRKWRRWCSIRDRYRRWTADSSQRHWLTTVAKLARLCCSWFVYTAHPVSGWKWSKNRLRHMKWGYLQHQRQWVIIP